MLTKNEKSQWMKDTEAMQNRMMKNAETHLRFERMGYARGKRPEDSKTVRLVVTFK
jgi:hypothetical protein